MPWRKWVIEVKTKLIAAIIVFSGMWAGALVGESKGIFGSVVWPIVKLGEVMKAAETGGDFYKIAYGGAGVLLYAALASWPLLLLSKERGKNALALGEERVMLYNEEIASAMQVIERKNAARSELEDAVERLMTSISAQIVDIFKGSISLRKTRYAFLMADPLTQEIMRVRAGNHFPLSDSDLRVVEWIGSTQKENPYLEAVVKRKEKKNNMEVIGLMRNPGEFRFGFAIFLPKKELITEQTRAEFAAAASVVQYIAYMDKLFNLMLELNQSSLKGR